MGQLGNIVLTVGHVVLTVAVPTMETFATVAEFVGQFSDTLLVVFATMERAAIPAMIGGLATMTGMLGTVAAAVGTLAAALGAATGPWADQPAPD